MEDEKYQLFRVVTAAVIHDENGKFLLSKRDSNDKSLPGFWSIPAGHTEIFENTIDVLENNLTREIKEEIGVDVIVEKYLDSHSWITKEYNKITIVFICKIGKGEPKALMETSEVRWFSFEEVPSLTLPANVLRVIEKAHNFLENK